MTFMQRYDIVEGMSLVRGNRRILGGVKKVGATAMSIPTKASDMIEVMSRNTFSVNDYVRGKLGRVVASFAAGEAEPYFIANRAGAVTGVILGIEDLRNMVEILETIQRVRDIEEERLATLAEQRSESPIVAGLHEVLQRYGIDPGEIKQIIPNIEFE